MKTSKKNIVIGLVIGLLLLISICAQYQIQVHNNSMSDLFFEINNLWHNQEHYLNFFQFLSTNIEDISSYSDVNSNITIITPNRVDEYMSAYKETLERSAPLFEQKFNQIESEKIAIKFWSFVFWISISLTFIFHLINIYFYFREWGE